MDKTYDVIVIGGSVAGSAAAINTTRHGLRTLLVAQSFQGESNTSKVENWLGEPVLSSKALAQKLEAHIMSFHNSLAVKMPATVTEIKKSGSLFELKTLDDQFQTKTLIIATGSSPRKSGVEGEDHLCDKGISYCVNCDAPFYAGKQIAVIATGDQANEAIKTLSKYAKKIYFFDPIGDTENESMRDVNIIRFAKIIKIEGETWVNGITYIDLPKKEQKTLPIDGVFVELGRKPNTNLVKDLVKLDGTGFIVSDLQTGATSQAGLFAAGDVTNGKYKQFNIAAGDGVKAALATRDYLASQQMKGNHD